MKFSNYCLIVLGEIDGVREEITKVSESDINILKAKGLIIATFSSVVTVSELNDYFLLNERNFIVFKMEEENFAGHLKDDNINDTLFKKIMKSDVELEDMSKDLINDIMKSIKSNHETVSTTNHSGYSNTIRISGVISDAEIVTEDFESYVLTLDETEKRNLVNKLMDKGLENLTDKDKKYLILLTKK